MRELRSAPWLVVSALGWIVGCASGGARSDAGAAGAGASPMGGGTAGAAGQAADADATAGHDADSAAPTAGAGGAGAGGHADAGADDLVDASTETAPDAAKPCTTAGTELCEDFESGAIDPKIWGMHATTGTSLTVDGTHVHGGTHALHVKMVAGGQGTAQITDAVTFPAMNNTFYTRAYFYFSPDLPADMMGGFHEAYLLATGNNTLGYVEAGLGSAGNKQYVGYSEYYGDGADVHQHGPTFTEFGPDSPTMVVPQQWICLELMQGGDTTTTHRRVWVDGKELPEQVSDFSDRPPPNFSLMSIGVLQYHQTPLLSDIWVDDIRVSRARIGCD